MRTPTRKPGKYTFDKPDPYLTQKKYDEFKVKLERMKKRQPALRAEVKRLASDGDFSENVPYQLAKGRLRGLNQRIYDLEEHLKRAVIIEPASDGVVRVGSSVTVEVNGRSKTFKILGSSEVDIARNIISRNSPIGSALLGHRVGDVVRVVLKDRELAYRVVGVV